MIDQLLDQRYKVLQILGAGGFGRTYIAQDLKQPSKPKCVIKQLQPQGVDDPTLSDASRDNRWDLALKFFEKEAETLEVLGNHDQIPRLLAYFEEEQEFYLVQEFIDGHPLSSELIQGQPWSETQAIALLKDVLTVLEFVHGNSVIHRDIKPDNIIRRKRDNKLVLVDFGAVKQVRGQMVTNSGAFGWTVSIGTEGYRPPEQAAGRPRLNSDLYALGMIAIQALTGINAFDLRLNYSDPNTDEIHWQDKVTNVSPGLIEFLTKMLRQNWRDRYESATAALQALESLTANTPGNNYQPTVVPTAVATQLPVTTPPPAPVAGTEVAPAAQSTPQPAPQPAPQPIPASTPASTPATTVSNTASKNASKPLPLKPIGLAVAGILALALVGGGVRSLMSSSGDSNQAVSNSTVNSEVQSDNELISSGDRILIPNEGLDNKKFQELKEAGVAAMAQKDYVTAYKNFNQALTIKRNAPETLIYLNNAEIGDKKSYTLAAVVPIKDGKDPNRPLEMLRGFAQAQKEVNDNGGINGVPLKLVIVNDYDNPEKAKGLAEKLVKDSDIIGIMGHHISPVSAAVAPIYQREKLVLITPISVIDELTDGSNPYLFRMNRANIDKGANELADYMVNNWQRQKVAIFYNNKLSYIQTMKSAFEDELFNRGEVVGEFDLSSAGFNAYQSLKTAKENGAEVIALLPSLGDLTKTWEILRLKNEYPNEFGELKVLGDIVTLYRMETLQKGRDTEGIVLAVSWQFDLSDGGFSRRSQDLWGGGVNWVTAMSYDAAQAFIAAMEKSANPTRESIQQALNDSSFVTTGASGEIRFKQNDVIPYLEMVTVKKKLSVEDSISKTGYDFVPVESGGFSSY
jgi:ABC-type branched-subunit amino acid transport system substrate-binding protein/tRNA A-37 threonylcarbamoyl transferase component Bud32